MPKGMHPNHVRGLDHPVAKAWTPPCEEQTLRDMYEGSLMSQAEIAEVFGISLKRVQTAMRRFGIQPRRAIKRDQRNVQNAYWRGSNATYEALHKRVEKLRGRPRRCTPCGTEDPTKSYDWANLTGRYEDPSDYERMCRSCHRRYDNARRGGVA